MTSAQPENTRPQGFETKSVPGYVPAAVPADEPVGQGIEAGFSNQPGTDATWPKTEGRIAADGGSVHPDNDHGPGASAQASAEQSGKSEDESAKSDGGGTTTTTGRKSTGSKSTS